MSKALVCFSTPNAHPLAWMLHKRHRHVFVSVLDVDRCTWVSYDWRQGNPQLQFDAVADYDLETYWRSCGLTVVSVDTGTDLPWGPWMLNNCVGHTKLILGVRSWAVTPHSLYLSLTGQTLLDRVARWLRSMTLVPGGGGGSTPPAVAPAGYQYVKKDTGVYTGTGRGGEEITLSKAEYDRATTDQAARTKVSHDDMDGTSFSFRGGPLDPNQAALTNKFQGIDEPGNASITGRQQEQTFFNAIPNLGSFKQKTERVLELIPGYTMAGPMTAVGYRPGEEFGDPLPPPVPTNPTGAGGSTAASVPTPSQTPPPKPTSAEARRPPKRPSSKRPDTASGSSGASGSTIQADVTGGALASTQRSLIG